MACAEAMRPCVSIHWVVKLSLRKCADTVGTVLVPSADHFKCWNIDIFFQIKYAEAILSNSTRKLLWFEITKMLITVYKNKSIVSFIIIFGTLSFPICVHFDFLVRVDHNNTAQRHQVFCSATTSTGIWDVLQHKLSNIARHLRTNDAGMSA